MGALPEDIENGGYPFDRLDKITWLQGLRGWHRCSVIRNAVSYFSTLKIMSSFFFDRGMRGRCIHRVRLLPKYLDPSWSVSGERTLSIFQQHCFSENYLINPVIWKIQRK